MATALVKEILHEYDPDQEIERIDGIITKLYEPKDAGQYQRQNGYFKDSEGNSMMITFAVPEVFQPLENENKRYIIECKKQTSGKGAGRMSGVKFKLEKAKGKEYPKIWVTGTAIIKVVSEGDSSTPPSRSNKSSGSAPASQSTEYQMSAQKLAERFATIAKLTYDACVEQGLPKEIVEPLSARAPEFAALWWFGAKDINIKEESMGKDEDKGNDEDMDWKSFVHPKLNKPLGKLTAGELISTFAAAFGRLADEEDLQKKPKLKQFVDVVTGPMATEHGVDPLTVLSAYVGTLDFIDDPDAAIAEAYGDELTEDDAIGLLGDKDSLIEKLKSSIEGGDEEEEFEDF